MLDISHDNNRFNSLLIKMFQFLFFMLIMFDFYQVVKIYCISFFFFFFHKNKNEINKIMKFTKIRTLGKKPGQTSVMSAAWTAGGGSISQNPIIVGGSGPLNQSVH